ncbi:ATP release protein [Pochonia chlamydosporia 170]|uniref:ATP release protein n=1 Tax=Pochonia chlamydosporia 170 TaxID=1380566 RepID=A0A179FIF3_METCM|nr:ATP release protein [Pochonia chlamydosporia 170]OAQ64799.1 ATP release protein [Pochonia chlamydosporia 170]
MSRYFPHTSYAEDQPLPHAILTTHVLTRAITAGSLIGLTITAIRQSIPSWRRPGPISKRILMSSSTGAIWGLGINAVGLAGRMYGRELIEWQDRSWRLLENRGQVEMDDWTYIGMAGGVVAALATGSLKGLGARGVLGSMGAGSVVGGLGWAGWRFGVNGGKFGEKEKEGDL